jgi:GNAT superfamily N-acetyltransferase
MKPVDDTPVWSVVCSYVAKPYRGRGLQHSLLAAAMSYARENGARVLEAYPGTRPNGVMTTSCSSDRAASMSAPGSAWSSGDRPPGW